MQQKHKKFRNFAFTDFSLENLEVYKTFNTTKCSYMILGFETCKSTSRKHLQGFVIWKSPKTFNNCKKLLPENIHIEQCYSAAISNIKYCEKDGNVVFEYGTRPIGQGKRSDYIVMRNLVDAGASMDEIISEATSYQAVRSAEIVRRYRHFYRTIQPIEVIWIWGQTGTGKTHFCFKEYPDLFRVNDNKWWCGYDAHETILFDDLRSSNYPFVAMLRYLDKYPFMVQYKGGSTQVQYTRVLITCPNPPDVEYAHCNEENIEQLLRRITTIKHLESPFVNENIILR